MFRRLRFFSVPPMHLFAARNGSTRHRSYRSVSAVTPAAIALPVPPSPENKRACPNHACGVYIGFVGPA